MHFRNVLWYRISRIFGLCAFPSNNEKKDIRWGVSYETLCCIVVLLGCDNFFFLSLTQPTSSLSQENDLTFWLSYRKCIAQIGSNYVTHSCLGIHTPNLTRVNTASSIKSYVCAVGKSKFFLPREACARPVLVRRNSGNSKHATRMCCAFLEMMTTMTGMNSERDLKFWVDRNFDKKRVLRAPTDIFLTRHDVGLFSRSLRVSVKERIRRMSRENNGVVMKSDVRSFCTINHLQALLAF